MQRHVPQNTGELKLFWTLLLSCGVAWLSLHIAKCSWQWVTAVNTNWDLHV